MRSLRYLPAVLATIAGLTIAGISPRPARALPAAFSIEAVKISGDVGIDAATASELGRTLRAVLRDELEQIAGFGDPKRPLIVSATVTRVSSERLAEASKATASVSLALLHADDRVLFAELRGRASVEDASANLSRLRNVALRRAAQRAMARLPEALERSNR